MIGLILVSCGPIGAVIHAGDPTRTAIEATRPFFTRLRVRLFVRRLATSLASVGQEMRG